MKKLNLLAAALLFASSGAFAAGSANDPFVVTINLTATCSVTTAAADMTFNYTAFQLGSTQNTSTAFTCSRGLTPKFRFDNTGADQTGEIGANLAAAIKGEGVIAGVRYTLAGASSRAAGTAASAGIGATAGSNGSADVYTVTIAATIPDNQAGDGTGTAAGSQTRTLYIEY